eukprot:c6785_g1_i1.p1 GENE.c6785_g1_i1~~c6785_g1_i1.p1  ORF type:complete len:406 (-),score=99.14 c6785_g1_i1:164-1309(-)
MNRDPKVPHIPLQETNPPKTTHRRGSFGFKAALALDPATKAASVPAPAHHSSEGAVWGAVVGNLFVTICKFFAYALSGSGSMLSEAIHSFADTMNQVLLIIGMKRAQAATGDGPVGHYRETYVWALISAVGIFFLGAGVTIHHGIQSLFDPSEIHDTRIALVVLLLSFVIEGSTLIIAINAVRAQAKQSKQSFFQYVNGGSDPTAVAVVLEDSVAVIGVLVAGISILITELTHNVLFDSIGSILIGLLLGFVAVFLIRKNIVLLTGVSPNEHQLKAFEDVLKNNPLVKKVVDFRGEMLGTGVCRLKADIDFDGTELGKRYLKSVDIQEIHQRVKTSPEELHKFLVEYAEKIMDYLGVVVDDLEAEVRMNVPGTLFIDIEAE